MKKNERTNGMNHNMLYWVLIISAAILIFLSICDTAGPKRYIIQRRRR
jgi:hypothetical protein